jgi:hypothetical protein
LISGKIDQIRVRFDSLEKVSEERTSNKMILYSHLL